MSTNVEVKAKANQPEANGNGSNHVDFHKAVKAYDFMTGTPEKLFELLNPFMEEGKIVGVVEQCREWGHSRNGDVNRYGLKVIFATDGNRTDLKGNTRKTNLGYWVELFEPVEEGTVFDLEANKVCIVHRQIIKDGEARNVKAIVERNSVIGEGMTLREGYTFVPNADMTKKGAQCTIIQGQKLFNLRFAPKAIEE